jgi:co-chaperonin GroES (HSP10)
MRRTIKEVDLEGVIRDFDLTLIGQKLVVVEKEVERMGSILIPDTAKSRDLQTNEGWVVAVGEDVTFCSPRDVVYYGRYSGAWIDRDDVKFRIMNEEDLLGKVKPRKEEENAG